LTELKAFVLIVLLMGELFAVFVSVISAAPAFGASRMSKEASNP